MIRPLCATDVDAFIAVRKESLRLHPFSFGAPPDRAYDREETIEMLSNKHNEDFILGKFYEKELVGLIGFVRKRSVKHKHKGFIWGMYVQAAYRGQGFARELMETCLAKANKIEGLKKVQLSVTNFAPHAQQLYESFGFEIYAKEHDAMIWDGHSMIEISMEKQL